MAGDYSQVFDLKAELAILEQKLAFPNKETMRPYLEKLLMNPSSMVFIAIEAPRGPDGPTIGKGWFSAQEREALRKALKTVNERRLKRKEKPTSESP